MLAPGMFYDKVVNISLYIKIAAFNSLADEEEITN